jgi:hypothetical protein
MWFGVAFLFREDSSFLRQLFFSSATLLFIGDYVFFSEFSLLKRPSFSSALFFSSATLLFSADPSSLHRIFSSSMTLLVFNDTIFSSTAV